MRGETVCLICNRKRIETVCGDQSCACRPGSPMRGSCLRPLYVIQGLSYDTPRGQMTTMACGRLVPSDKWFRVERDVLV